MRRWLHPEENYHKILRVMAQGEERESKILKHPTVLMGQPTSFHASPLCKLAENHFAQITGHRRAAISQHGRKVLDYLDQGYAWDVKNDKPDRQRGQNSIKNHQNIQRYAFTTGPQRTILTNSGKHQVLRRIALCEKHNTNFPIQNFDALAINQLAQNNLVNQITADKYALTDKGRIALNILNQRFNVHTIRGIDTTVPFGYVQHIHHCLIVWLQAGTLTHGRESHAEPDLNSLQDSLANWETPISFLRKNKEYLDDDSILKYYDRSVEKIKNLSSENQHFVNTIKEWIMHEKDRIGEGQTNWADIERLAIQVYSQDSEQIKELKKYFMQVKLSN